MDVYCTVCGEPWDVGELPYLADELEMPLKELRQKFLSDGCKVFGNSACVSPEDGQSLRSMATSVLAELSGDDFDGIASDLDDFEFMGMLD